MSDVKMQKVLLELLSDESRRNGQKIMSLNNEIKLRMSGQNDTSLLSSTGHNGIDTCMYQTVTSV